VRRVVAIDGPAASGKSTLARRLAERLGVAYLDTGAFYRAAALAVLRAGETCGDETAATMVVGKAVITQEKGRTRLNGEDVEREIRTPAVAAAASRVATLAEVRRMLVERQRQWVRERGGEAVVEGRDIGSVVFPEADVKVFLTASDDERTRRRAREPGGGSVTEVARTLAGRDRQDTGRVASPLRLMPDAVVVDTTTLGLEQVVSEVLKLVEANERGRRAPKESP